jgi:hypothetical protein
VEAVTSRQTKAHSNNKILLPKPPMCPSRLRPVTTDSILRVRGSADAARPARTLSLGRSL